MTLFWVSIVSYVLAWLTIAISDSYNNKIGAAIGLGFSLGASLTFYWFIYNFVVDMATGQYQLYQMILELAAVLKQ